MQGPTSALHVLMRSAGGRCCRPQTRRPSSAHLWRLLTTAFVNNWVGQAPLAKLTLHLVLVGSANHAESVNEGAAPEAASLTWMPLCPALIQGLGPFKGAPGDSPVILIRGLDECHTLQHELEGCKQAGSVQGPRALQMHLPQLPGRGVRLIPELWECLETASCPNCGQVQVETVPTAFWVHCLLHMVLRNRPLLSKQAPSSLIQARTDLAWQLELAAEVGAQKFGMCPAPQQAHIHRPLLLVHPDAEQSQRPQVVEQAGDPQRREAALIVPDAVKGAFLREQACRDGEGQVQTVRWGSSAGNQPLLLQMLSDVCCSMSRPAQGSRRLRWWNSRFCPVLGGSPRSSHACCSCIACPAEQLQDPSPCGEGLHR